MQRDTALGSSMTSKADRGTNPTSDNFQILWKGHSHGSSGILIRYQINKTYQKAILGDASESHGDLTAEQSVGKVPFMDQGKLLNVALRYACHRSIKRGALTIRRGSSSSCRASLLTRNSNCLGRKYQEHKQDDTNRSGSWKATGNWTTHFTGLSVTCQKIHARKQWDQSLKLGGTKF